MYLKAHCALSRIAGNVSTALNSCIFSSVSDTYVSINKE